MSQTTARRSRDGIGQNALVADPDADDLEAAGNAALESGQWGAARDAFAAALNEAETAGAAFGLAAALWWLGESQASVDSSTRAYALFRRVATSGRRAVRDVVVHHLQVELRQLRRGQRVDRTGGSPPAPAGDRARCTPGVGRPCLPDARSRRRRRAHERALAIARECDDVDLELVALSQLGLIRVAAGDAAAGFAMIDEAMAAALGGERSSLDTVVYTCCDMLNACELATDLERAAQWCEVADGFIEHVRLPVPVRRVPHALRRCARPPAAAGTTPIASWRRRCRSPPDAVRRCTARH